MENKSRLLEALPANSEYGRTVAELCKVGGLALPEVLSEVVPEAGKGEGVDPLQLMQVLLAKARAVPVGV